jgi:hypothetical protein
MIDPKRFIFSYAAVARMLGIKPSLVKKVEVWFNCVFVIVRGRRPRFWKKSVFSNHFANWRKEEGSKLYAVRTADNQFLVESSKKHKYYHVEALHQAIVCNCDDYQNQQKILGTGCCKHGYAALELLGFERLSEYIEHHLWVNNDDDYNEAEDYYDYCQSQTYY